MGKTSITLRRTNYIVNVRWLGDLGQPFASIKTWCPNFHTCQAVLTRMDYIYYRLPGGTTDWELFVYEEDDE